MNMHETITGYAPGYLSHTHGPKAPPLTGRAARRAAERRRGDFKPLRSRNQRKHAGRK